MEKQQKVKEVLENFILKTLGVTTEIPKHLLNNENYVKKLRKLTQQYGHERFCYNMLYSISQFLSGKVKNLHAFVISSITEDWGKDWWLENKDKLVPSSNDTTEKIPEDERKYYNRFFNATVRLADGHEYTLNDKGDYVSPDGYTIKLEFFVESYLNDNLEFVKENDDYLRATDEVAIKKLFTEPLR